MTAHNILDLPNEILEIIVFNIIGRPWKDDVRVYLMRLISSDELEEKISRFDENYFCTIEKILLWPDKIRIYIDERGDNSLGGIQHPRHSTIAYLEENSTNFYGHNTTTVCDSNFSIADEKAQYLGYLDFVINISFDCIGKVLYFQYGHSGYSMTKLFHIKQSFIDKYNLLPLMRKCQNIG
ncbi:unnamed protein product [Rotaria sp. Silwood1]|nr:unnamed protein product [Rotaria sp. Silwood1]CAF3553619.1 unnamed protein product [Rotaria sp. Silwood1]